MGVVEVRRQPDAWAILAAARRAADVILLVERRRQLTDVEVPRLERDDRDRARRIRAGPDLQAVDLAQPGEQRLGQLARALLDLRAADPGLERQRLTERHHRRLVALAEPFERARHADAAGIGAEDARPDLRLRALVDVEDAVLLRAAGPLVRAAAVKVRLHVAQVDVDQAERLRAVHQREDAALAGQRAERLGRKQIADRAGLVGEGDHSGSRRDRLGERVDVVLHPRVRVRRRHVLDGEAEALRLLLPRGVVARVVVGGEQHLVRRLQIDAGRDQVVRLAGVARDHDLLRRHAEELGEQLAGVFAAVAQLGAVLLRRILVHVPGQPVHRLEHGAGRRTEVRGIQHRELFRHHELIAHALPELFVWRRGRGRQVEGAWPRHVRRQERGRTADGQKPGKFATIHESSCRTGLYARVGAAQ